MKLPPAIFILPLILLGEFSNGRGVNEPVSVNPETGSSLYSSSSLIGIEGRVLNKQGSPIEGASIYLACASTSCPPIPELGVLTNKNGEFFWPIEPGKFSISVYQHGRASKKYIISVQSTHPTPLEIVLDE